MDPVTLRQIVRRKNPVNLLDPSGIEYGGYYGSGSGAWTPNTTYCTTGLIPVRPGRVYRISGNILSQYTFWDAQGRFVSSYIDSENTRRIQVPNNPAIRFMRYPLRESIFLSDPTQFMCVEGEELPDEFVPYTPPKDVLLDTLSLDIQNAIARSRVGLVNAKTYLRIPSPYTGSSRDYQVTHPSVWTFPSAWNGYKYWLAVTPYPNASAQYENPCIFVSNDGVKWEVPPGVTNPLDEPEAGCNSDPCLVYHEGTDTLELWWRNVSSGNQETLFRRVTQDGVTWTPKEEMLVAKEVGGTQLLSPSIIFEDGRYRMWVGRNWYIYHMESDDGKTWSNIEQIKANGEAIHTWHPSVQKFGDTYYLVNCDQWHKLGIGGELKYATSHDGLNWSAEKHLLTHTGNPWDVDGAGVYRACLAATDDGFALYYGMITHNNRWYLGMSRGRTLDTLVGIDDDVLRHYGVIE